MTHNNARTIAVVPAYNPSSEELRQTVSSLLQQTVPVDLCIVDDGSTVPVDDYFPPHPQVTILRLERNQGIASALNYGIQHAQQHGYVYACRLDVGDIAYPERVSAQLRYMDNNTDVDILGAAARVVPTNGEPAYIHGSFRDAHHLRSYLPRNAPFKHSTFFMRLASLRKVGAYSIRYRAAEDYELLLRYNRLGRIASLPDVLVDYVESDTGLSAGRRREQLLDRLTLQLSYFQYGRWDCYWGVLRTIGILLTPARVVKRLSAGLWRAAARNP